MGNENRVDTILDGLAARGFSDAEFKQRLRSTQHLMQASDTDMLLLTTEPEIRYFSGFFTQFWQSPTRPWFLLVPATGDPVAVIPTIGEACMKRCQVEDIRTWSSPHPTDDGVSLLVDTVHDLIGTSGRIGLLKGRETTLRMPLGDYEKLATQLSAYRLYDATELVMRRRQLKSAEEIAKIESACRIAGRSFEQVMQFVRIGSMEREVFRQFKLCSLACGADDVSYLVGASANMGYDDIISPPTDRELGDGDILILDTGCVYDGYFCDYDRNYALGSVDSSTNSAYKQVHQALEAGLEAAKPGIRCCDLFDTMRQELKTDDAGSVGRLGHGLGMQLTESPSIAAFDTTELQTGMVMTLEPAMSYGDGRLMVHEENIVIEESGPRLLTSRASPTIPLIL